MKKTFGVIFLIVVASVVFFATQTNYFEETPQVITRVQEEVTKIKEDIKPSKKQVFLFMGDTGNGEEDQYQVADAIVKYCRARDCEALFLLGDVVYDQGVRYTEDPRFIEKFEKPYKNIDFPIYIAYGNHDVKGCTECYIKYAEISDKWNMEAEYYVVDFPDISFLVTNTEGVDKKQMKWLTTNLDQRQDKWTAVLGHRPIETYVDIYYQKDWDGRQQMYNAVCDNADLIISAHAHILEDNGNVDDCHVQQLVSGNGGSKPRTIVPQNQSAFFLEERGFVGIEVNNQELLISYMDKFGNTLYSRDY